MSIEILKEHLNSKNFNYLQNNISHHYIASENPEDHWHLLQVNNEIVLDLGCGYHLIEQGWMTTPEYFLSKGAKKIIGVDPNSEDIKKLSVSYASHNFYEDSINSVNKLNTYINNNNITSLKMDIEGDEKYFLDSQSNFDSLKYVAIETHNRDLLNQTIYKLIDLQFKITTVCTFYPRVYNVCNLIYAHR